VTAKRQALTFCTLRYENKFGSCAGARYIKFLARFVQIRGWLRWIELLLQQQSPAPAARGNSAHRHREHVQH
jgi:hypothetical protein